MLLPIFVGRKARPATEGAGEITWLGEAQQVGNLTDTPIGIANILCGQLLARLIEQVLETDSFRLQFSLQVSDAQVQGVGDAVLSRLTIR